MQTKLITVFLFASFALCQSSEVETEVPFDKNDKVLFIIPRHCYEKLLKFKISSACVSAILSSFLSFGIILGSLFFKIPQILEIISTKSAKGLTPLSQYIELFSQQCNITYYYYLSYPLQNYGENLSSTAQSLIIFLLSYMYKGMNTITFFFYGMIIASTCVCIYWKMLPETVISYMLMANVTAFCFSRLVLIVNILRTRNTGSLNLITLFLGMAGVCVRVFTTMIDLADDKVLIIANSMNALFSVVLFIVAVIFKKKVKKD